MADNRREPDGLPPIDLARTQDHEIGGLTLRPSLRQVETASGSQTLEPRVMQVLVAFVERRGSLVSRDELIRRCWGGRVVSKDAINRCIVPVRRLGQESGAYSLETITRVGYRLLASDVAAPAPTPAAPGPVAPAPAIGVEVPATTVAAAASVPADTPRLPRPVWWKERKVLVARLSALATALRRLVAGVVGR